MEDDIRISHMEFDLLKKNVGQLCPALGKGLRKSNDVTLVKPESPSARQ